MKNKITGFTEKGGKLDIYVYKDGKGVISSFIKTNDTFEYEFNDLGFIEKHTISPNIYAYITDTRYGKAMYGTEEAISDKFNLTECVAHYSVPANKFDELKNRLDNVQSQLNSLILYGKSFTKNSKVELENLCKEYCKISYEFERIFRFINVFDKNYYSSESNFKQEVREFINKSHATEKEIKNVIEQVFTKEEFNPDFKEKYYKEFLSSPERIATDVKNGFPYKIEPWKSKLHIESDNSYLHYDTVETYSSIEEAKEKNDYVENESDFDAVNNDIDDGFDCDETE